MLAGCQIIAGHVAKVRALPGREEVTELPQGAAWLNVSRALNLRQDLRGKLSIFECALSPVLFGERTPGQADCLTLHSFWTFCCINCIHVLPELDELERKYADRPVTFIGIHSAKFEKCE